VAFSRLLASIAGSIANKVRAPQPPILPSCCRLARPATSSAARLRLTPDWSVTPDVMLAAVGQAFYATGVGMAMMLAYGAYVPKGVSLLRSALWITGSIILVSLLATVMVFPLVFRYGMDPAQGARLVFEVLPAAFAEMPGGRLVGTLFFVFLSLAALTPSIAGIEPLVAWLERSHGIGRVPAVVLIALRPGWWVPLGALFSLWSAWRPLAPGYFAKIFRPHDFVSSNVLLPIGAILTCILWAGFRPRHPGRGAEAARGAAGGSPLRWPAARDRGGAIAALVQPDASARRLAPVLAEVARP
jgi:NSS family neurotransmitter:Na+ symporter